MPRLLDPFRCLLIAVAGWMNQHQLQIIDYLSEENRVLREQLAGRRLRFNDDQRRRDWGYRRSQGALSNLGHEIARSTIADILARHGIEPAPERGRKTTWKEFLTRHGDLIVAADFFTAAERVAGPETDAFHAPYRLHRVDRVRGDHLIV